MICDRCHKPIRKGQKYKEHAPGTGSGVAPTVFMHDPPCDSAPHQQYPEVRDARRRISEN